MASHSKGGQKPVHLRPSGPLSHADKLWAAMRQLKKFDLVDLQSASLVPMSSVHSYLLRCRRAGYVEQQGINKQGRSVYGLVKDVGIETPRLRADGSKVTQGIGRELMWRTMRILKDFSEGDLLVQAQEAGVKMVDEAARSYCMSLVRAGYLKSYCNPTKRYKLLPSRNTGPKPPMIQRLKQVYDPNLGKVMWSQNILREDGL